jgi:glycosyltransferase involved in cell wall biosynthesis
MKFVALTISSSISGARLGSVNSLDKKLLWLSFLYIDKSLHKTTQIEVLRNLAKRGYEVSLLALNSDKKAEINDPDLRVISLPMRDKAILTNALFVIALLFFLPFYIMRFKPTYIIIEPQDATAFSLIPIALLPKSKRPKIILDARTEHIPKPSPDIGGFFFDNSFHIAKKLFDGITTITPMMKSDFCSRYHIESKRVGVWTSGVNTELFNPQNFSKERTELREKFGIDKKLVLLYHGVFGAADGSSSRGIVQMVEGIALLKDKIDDIALFLLGRGACSQRILEIVREHEIQDRVIVHDRVDYKDVPKFIAMCDVGLQAVPDRPEWRSQCGLALLEYLAMEKPVIVTNLPVNSYVVGNCKCGIYISSTDPSDIAKGVSSAYNRKQELEKLGSYGRAIINRKFTWEKVAESFDQYLMQT